MRFVQFSAYWTVNHNTRFREHHGQQASFCTPPPCQPCAGRAGHLLHLYPRTSHHQRRGHTTYRGSFTTDAKTGAVNGTGTVQWKNGNRYEGPVVNTQLTGKGSFTWANGDTYVGDLVNAQPHGQGTYTFKSGDRYTGAWRNGQKHGMGTYTFANGSVWEGEFANDQQFKQGAVAVAPSTPAVSTPVPAAVTTSGPVDANAATPPTTTRAELEKRFTQAWNAKDWPLAEAISREIIARPDAEAYNFRNLGRALASQGKHLEAITVGKAAFANKKPTVEDLKFLCWHLILANQPLEARSYCAQSLAVEPKNYAVLVNLGHTYFLTGDPTTADTYYRKTIPEIKDEKTLKEGPLEDYRIFVKNGWFPEASKQLAAEFEANWKAHVAQQEKLRREGDPNKYSTTPGNPQCKFFNGFGDNGDGTVIDPRTQLVWKRCSEGQAWNGTACTGQPTKMYWFDVMQAAKDSRFLGKNDWRLPSKDELSAVVGEYEGGCKNNDTKKGQYAVSGTLGKEGHLWSYSSNVDYSNGAWGVYFDNGGGGYYRYHDLAVRLVRASQSSAGAAGLAAFNAEYKKMGVYKAAVIAEQKREAQQREEEARKEQARKQQEALEEKRRIAYENSPAGRAAAREAQAREERERAQRCSHLYVGKVVALYGLFNIKINATVQGIGNGMATVKYLSLADDWTYKEFSCDELH